MAQPGAAVATGIRMYQGQPGTVEGTAYTAPPYVSESPYQAGATALARRIIVCNPTAATATFTLYLVPTGDTAGVANVIFSAVEITAGQTQIFDLEQEMDPGDFLAVMAGTAAALTVTISGVTFQ